MSKKLLLYVAGPYRLPEDHYEENVHKMISVCDELANIPNVAPLCPLLNHYWDIRHKRKEQFWLDYDIVILERCDGIFRMPGKSSGADNEVKIITDLGKPSFTTYSQIEDWAVWSQTYFPR